MSNRPVTGDPGGLRLGVGFEERVEVPTLAGVSAALYDLNLLYELGLLLSADRQKFVRESGPGVPSLSVQAEMSFRYSPQAQSSASSGVPVNPPLGKKESS